jgi:hypothetical protein
MALTVQEQVLEEIRLIPEDQLTTVYAILHYFRVGLEADQCRPQSVMQYAGCWADMAEDEFEGLMRDLQVRRRQAFSGRVVRETSIG